MKKPPVRPGGKLAIRPLTPKLMDALGLVLKGSWGSSCWCMYPRLPDGAARLPASKRSTAADRRSAMAELAAGETAPGLLAFDGDEAVGWIAVAPRAEFPRIVNSRATPPVDDQPVWVIPCVTVRPSARGRGIAVALIREAARYAASRGAKIVEAYPREGAARVSDDSAFFGTEEMFRRAGFRVARPPLPDRPKNWIPRPAMRLERKRPSRGRP